MIRVVVLNIFIGVNKINKLRYYNIIIFILSQLHVIFSLYNLYLIRVPKY